MTDHFVVQSLHVVHETAQRDPDVYFREPLKEFLNKQDV